jgi:hypothetical protein
MTQATDLLDGILKQDTTASTSPTISQSTVLPVPASKPSVISQISGSGSPPSKSPADPAKPPDKDQGEALIGMCDALTPMAMRMVAMRYRVKWTTQLEKSCRLSETEKQSLRICAASAAGFVSGLVSQSDKIAGVIFLGLWGSMMWSKAGDIKELAPPKETKHVEEAINTGETAGVQEQAEKPKRGRPRKQ